MIGDYTNTSAYLVEESVKELYDGVPISSPLTISATPPTVNYRCRVTLSAATGHTDYTGTVTIGSDTLTFSAAGTKITTTTITASTKPAVSYSGIDCNLKIECLDVCGQPIYSESLTAINVRLEPHQSSIQQPNGTYTKITDTAIYSTTALAVGDTIRINSTDYTLKQVDPEYDLGGEIEYYSCLA